MTGQKTKLAVKKVTAVKPKTSKTVGAVAGKKVVAKKTVAAAAEPKMTKLPATKKAAAAIANKAAAKPSPEERYRMVETAAYYIAEKHGFQGRSDEHWAAAERAIAINLGQ